MAGMTVVQIMSPAPVVVDPTAPLRDVCRLMAEYRIRHVPVVSADGLVGIMSDRDVREALPSPIGPDGAAEHAAAMDRIAVWEVMAEQVITVTPQTPLAQAIHLMTGHKIGCLPVMEAGRLVGIVTETDALRGYATLLDDLSGSPRLELAVRDAPGRLREISRLFAEVPLEVGAFMGAWTEPVGPGQIGERILMLRFQAFTPQEIFRVLRGAGIEVLDLAERKREAVTVSATITRILNPTDLSVAAEAPSRLAARLAMRTQATLVLYHVRPPEPAGAEPAQPALLDESRTQLQLWFETVVPEEARRFLPVEYRVAIGAPDRGILWAVGETKTDLIVMGTHGRSGVSHLLMGSVTASVLRAAPVPILALRMGEGDDRLGVVRRILWATDLSPASEEAWRYALRLADVFAAEVFLLHVVPPSDLAGVGDILVPPPWNWLGRHLKPIEAELERRQREVEALGLAARRKVAVGSPASMIVSEAETEQADLIVVGAHGYTGLTHVLLGSVAEAVIRKASCPVLAVRVKAGGEGKKEEESVR